jgi:hypothetical protein
MIVYEKIGRTLENSVLEAKESLILFAPFITSKGLKPLFDNLNEECDVTLISRFALDDFESGFCDARAIELAVLRNVKLLSCRNLHAKGIVINKKLMAIGSANFTGMGLGIDEQVNNLECFTRFFPVKDNEKKFLDHLFSTSTVIRGSELLSIISKASNLSILKRTENLLESEFPKSSDSGLFERKMTRVFKWLNKEINDEYISFGFLSSRLHDALSRNPGMTRRRVKEIQHNLFRWLKIYRKDSFKFRRNRKSESIRRIVLDCS